jgi:hypothetical protein
MADQSESELHYNWQSVSQSVCLGVEPSLGLLTRDLTSLFFFFKVTVLSYLGRPLWREVGSVICQLFVIIGCSSLSIYIYNLHCVLHTFHNYNIYTETFTMCYTQKKNGWSLSRPCSPWCFPFKGELLPSAVQPHCTHLHVSLLSHSALGKSLFRGTRDCHSSHCNEGKFL